MKNKGIIIATTLFVVAAVLDLFSTSLLGKDLLQFLETNPFYSLLGIPGLVVLNLGVAALFFYGYKLTTRATLRYSFLLCMVSVTLLRVFIIINNLSVASNPPTVEQVQGISEEFRRSYYLLHVVQPLLVAYVPAFLAFFLFEKDHKITVKS